MRSGAERRGRREGNARRRGPACQLCRHRSSGRVSTDTPALNPQPQHQTASRAARLPHTLRRHTDGLAYPSPSSLLFRAEGLELRAGLASPTPGQPKPPRPGLPDFRCSWLTTSCPTGFVSGIVFRKRRVNTLCGVLKLGKPRTHGGRRR